MTFCQVTRKVVNVSSKRHGGGSVQYRPLFVGAGRGCVACEHSTPLYYFCSLCTRAIIIKHTVRIKAFIQCQFFRFLCVLLAPNVGHKRVSAAVFNKRQIETQFMNRVFIHIYRSIVHENKSIRYMRIIIPQSPRIIT